MKELVYFDEKNEVCIANYSGFLTLEQFQSIATKVQELRISKSSNIQLALVEDLKVLSPEIQAWINSHWFPEAVKTGLRFLGFIIPKSAIATMSMKSANKDVEQNSQIEIRYFPTIEEAIQWTQEMKSIDS